MKSYSVMNSCEGRPDDPLIKKPFSQKKQRYGGLIFSILTIAGLTALILHNGMTHTQVSSVELLKDSSTGDMQHSIPEPEQVGISSTGRPILPVQVGALPVSVWRQGDLCKGYKTTSRGRPLRTEVFKNCDDTLVLDKITNAHHSVDIITSSDRLAEVLDVRGELSVSMPAFSGSGSGQFLREQTSTRNRVVVTYVDRVAYYQISVLNRNLKLSLGMNDIVSSNTNDMTDVYDEYGTYMTTALQYGCSIFIRYELTSETEVDRTDLQAELVGRIGIGFLSGEMRANLEVQRGEERAKLNLRIVGEVNGLNIDFSNIPMGVNGFNRVNEIIGNYTLGKAELENALEGVTEIDELREIGLTERFVPVGMELSRIENYVGQHFPNIDERVATHIKRQTENVGRVLRNTFLLEARLIYTGDMLRRLPPRERTSYYEPFRRIEGKSRGVIRILNNKCFEFLGKSVREITNPMEYAPEDLSVEEERTILDLVGEGYIEHPWQSPNMHFEGYVLDRGDGREPFYKGLLKCHRRFRHEAIEGRVDDLKHLVEEATCGDDLREGICGCEFPCDSHPDAINPSCGDGLSCGPDRTCVPQVPKFIQRGCSPFTPWKDGSERFDHRFPVRLALVEGNAETCSNMCSQQGYPFFGFECPHATGVWCQCYSEERVGRKHPSFLNCKSFVNNEYDHACTESGMVDGISMGGAWIGSIYEVPQE